MDIHRETHSQDIHVARLALQRLEDGKPETVELDANTGSWTTMPCDAALIVHAMLGPVVEGTVVGSMLVGVADSLNSVVDMAFSNSGSAVEDDDDLRDVELGLAASRHDDGTDVFEVLLCRSQTGLRMCWSDLEEASILTMSSPN